MLVCLCQSFKQLVANDRTTNFFFSHPHAYHDDARVSVFSLCFFLFFLFCLLYRFIFYTNYLGIVLIFRFVCSWLFSPLTSQRLSVSPLSQLHAFHSSKVQFTSAGAYDFIYTSRNARNIFPHSANFPLSLSLSLSLFSSRTILTKRFCIYRKKRERSFTEKVTLSLSLSFSLQSFVSVDAIFFFFLEIYLSAAETDLQVGMYTTLYLPTRYKKFYALYMRIALCTQNFCVTKTKIYDLSSHFLVSLEICLAFRVPFRFFLYITSND